jgi:hypothetical protein
MTTGFRAALDLLIASNPDRDLMIKLVGDPNPQPIGPGKVSRYTVPLVPSDPTSEQRAFDGLYVIESIAMRQTNGGQPQAVLLPIVFSADALLWLSEGIKEMETSKIATPGGGRTPGGLYVG